MSLPRTNDENLVCLLATIRSVHKNVNSLTCLIQQFELSVIALTETWLSPSITDTSIFGHLCSQFEV